MELAHVTSHAQQRMHERMGIRKKSSRRVASLALVRGLKTEDTTGQLEWYVRSVFCKHETANNIRIYNEKVFVFQDQLLITVYSLPHKYRSTAVFCNQRKCHADVA